MTAYATVLFIHLLSLFVGVGTAAVLAVCLFKLRAAVTLNDAVPWASVARKTSRMFPIAIVGLFGSGAYLTADVWTWGTDWIVVGIAALVVLAVQGPLLGERSEKKLEQALRSNGPGPLGEDARRMTRHPGLWIATFSAVGLVLGIVWSMIQKPGLGGAVAAAVCGYVIGASLAMFFARSGRGPADVTAEATAP